MNIKTFQIKPKTTKAIQFIDKGDNAEYLAGTYIDIILDGTTLYFIGGYEAEKIWDGDWILLDDERAIEIVDSAVFESMYEEVK